MTGVPVSLHVQCSSRRAVACFFILDQTDVFDVSHFLFEWVITCWQLADLWLRVTVCASDLLWCCRAFLRGNCNVVWTTKHAAVAQSWVVNGAVTQDL